MNKAEYAVPIHEIEREVDEIIKRGPFEGPAAGHPGRAYEYEESQRRKAGMTGLKPCPFCGGKPEYTDDYYGNGTNYHNVFCTECGAGSAYISGFNTKSARNQVIEAWNRRAEGEKQE